MRELTNYTIDMQKINTSLNKSNKYETAMKLIIGVSQVRPVFIKDTLNTIR